MAASKAVQLSERIYFGLLRLYPAAFHESYGREMCLIFRHQCHKAYRRAGINGVIRLWGSVLFDLIRTAPAEHFSTYQGGNPMTRRGCDIAISLLIKLDSRGSVFYVSQRGGQNGHTFTMYKLRSMTQEANERRITRIGRFLRWTRLDEYPQFYNVLRGDMSLFGPRPLTSERANSFQLGVKPGLVPWFSR